MSHRAHRIATYRNITCALHPLAAAAAAQTTAAQNTAAQTTAATPPNAGSAEESVLSLEAV